MRDTEREAETQAEEAAGPMQGARRGTRFRVSRITPWAEGRCQTAEPPRDPLYNIFECSFIFIFIFFKFLFIYDSYRERERQRHTGREREKQAPCREPDVGLDPWSPGSRPGRKAGAKPLSHPGIPSLHPVVVLLWF